jgi:two-component system NtrC family sensor kinase
LGGQRDLERELAESRAREAALAEVLGVMRRAPGELAAVLDAVLDRAASLCGAERASIHLLDGDVYRTAAFWGPRNAEYERVAYDTTRKPGRETLIGRVALEREVTHIPDVLADQEYAANELQKIGGYRTMLGVPLFRGDVVAGVFVLTRNKVMPFTDHEIALVRAFADQAVVAVENARLFNETREALEQQRAVSDVLQTISRSAFDLRPVLDTVVESAARLTNSLYADLMQVDDDVARQIAHYGEAPAEYRKIIDEKVYKADRGTLAGRVLLQRRVVLINDVLADPDYRFAEAQRLLGYRALLGVPLMREDRLTGVLAIARLEPGPFSDREVSLVQTFADQASIAIENVRLFNETKESLEQQTAIASVLGAISRSAFDLDLVLTTIIENAVRLTDAANGTILGIEGSSGQMLVTTEPESERTTPGVLEPSRRSLTGRVLLERRTVHIEDIGSDPEYDLTGYSGPACTMLGVPLHLRGELIGVLLIRRRDVRAFNADQIRIAETFADQAAIAMDNVRLFNAVERQREELSRFLSPQVAALVTSAEGAKMLEGHRRQITVAFCDLRGFTHFAETAEPEEVLGLLRDYHRAMGQLIVEHQGTLEHFAGDGMMVFFNDPVPVERHELQAVRMACAMRDHFDQMARSWQKRGYELGFGVGIATGYATLGRIGFEGRYDYGAIGNVVILAQRLSAEAKAGQILLSQRVHAAVEADAETTGVGDLALKGFTRPVPAFAAESVKAPTPART